MEKLLELAKSRGCKAEVFSVRDKSVSMSKENGAVSDVSASIQSGVSLRVIRDGKIGTAFTRNLINREELLENALLSLNAGVEVYYDFPDSGTVVHQADYDPSVEEKGYSDLKGIISAFEPCYSDMNDGVLSVSAGAGTTELRLLNTSGADLTQRDSEVYAVGSMTYPGSGTGLRNIIHGKSEVTPYLPDIERTVRFFNDSLPEVSTGDCKMKVLIAPEVMYAMTWRLSSATSAKAFHDKVSPLLNKRGQQVLSPKISLVSDPTTGATGTRLFDDEGVAAASVPIFDKGVFKTVYNNLDYASRLGEKPVGTGFRGGMWGGDRITLLPAPSLAFAVYETGDKTFEEMLAMMDRGVIIFGVLGAHSGNILNGDLSIGLSPGLLVENGKVVGRVKDGMVAGNVYEMFSNVAAVENQSHYTGSMYENPSVLLDDVSVAGS
ncbi:hypothetical protein CSA37_07825 [Candidatus Fermentibacteria bacterium]|nr:MAG: hypothetical protein CSA37_07825 [Candidatus Fermentibacteria bacterium]